jgi:hypothetical protein
MSQTMPTESYSQKHLSTLIGVTKQNAMACKSYIQQYFFKTHKGIFFYDVVPRKFQQIKEEEIHRYIPNGLKMKYLDVDISKDTPITLKCRQWLIDDYDYDTFELILKLGEPQVNRKNGTINLMGLEKHSFDNETYESMPKKSQNGVQLMLDHILNIWCSGKTEQYEYILTWLSCIGRKKIKSCLYLQSLEQTGKTLVIEFLEKYVYGSSLVLKTENMEVINTYTSLMEGKVLVNVNEMPCASAGEWKKLMNKLKSLISDSTFDCRSMHTNPRTSINTFMMILTSNNDAVSLSDTNFMRYKCPDVSNSMIGNKAYFDKLCGATMNDECGRAFHLFLKERFSKYGKSFDVNSFPKTDTFKDKMCEKLDVVFKFLKSEYIQTNTSIDKIPLSEIYFDFKDWCQTQSGFKQTISDKKFNKKLKELKCVTYKRIFDVKTGKKPTCYSVKVKDLLNEFSNKGWIHELDDIDEIKEQKPKIVNNINITIVNEKGVVQSNDGWILKEEVKPKTKLYKSESEEEESEEESESESESESLFGNFKKCGKVSL